MQAGQVESVAGGYATVMLRIVLDGRVVAELPGRWALVP